MKPILRIALAALLLAVVALPVSAEETGEMCTVRADSVSGQPGGTVSVPVRMENNPGFTNFGIALDYDREQLELVDIRLADEQQKAYLCGSCAEANIAWDPAEDAHAAQNTHFAKNMTYGYVACASGEAAAEDGVLFTATFRLTEAFAEEALVTPIVNYIRTYEPQNLTFDAVSCTESAGSITPKADCVLGDGNADGIVSPQELIAVIRAYRGNVQDDAVIRSADSNENGMIDPAELIRIVKNYRGG